jgi:hypothetical protein
MITKEFNSITIRDFQDLIDNGKVESNTLEYKQEFELSNDTEKKEFLADISSFANTTGGDLIYGIKEDRKTGLPVELCGIEVSNGDEIKLRIENTIRDNIVPRLSSLQIETYELTGNKKILLLRIAKSWNSPHQVTFRGHDKFYARAGAGKYQMNIDQLRTTFLQTNNISGRLRNFIADRVAMIAADDTPVTLLKHPKITLHAIPISSFDTGNNYDLTSANSPFKSVRQLNGGSRTPRFNLDGLITASQDRIMQGQYESYAQVFRNGVIETVNAELLVPFMGERYIPASGSLNYEKHIVDTIEEYLSLYEEMKISMPVFVFLTFIDVKGYKLRADTIRPMTMEHPGIQRGTFTLPEIMIMNQDNVTALLKTAFDTIWNACGYARSYNFDENGIWKPLR